ncbi:hypothetical protein C8J57DRAFT_1211483 [Mycena rebaudengoi]|nr:hypothetical protein C8J57DRAFT_1211483 [Mycena rebaudengoi]
MLVQQHVDQNVSKLTLDICVCQANKLTYILGFFESGVTGSVGSGRQAQAQIRAGVPNQTGPTLQPAIDGEDQILRSCERVYIALLKGALSPRSTIPPLRYIVLVVSSLAYLLHHSTPSTQVKKIEASLKGIESLFGVVMKECASDPCFIAEEGLRLATEIPTRHRHQFWPKEAIFVRERKIRELQTSSQYHAPVGFFLNPWQHKWNWTIYKYIFEVHAGPLQVIVSRPSVFAQSGPSQSLSSSERMACFKLGERGVPDPYYTLGECFGIFRRVPLEEYPLYLKNILLSIEGCRREVGQLRLCMLVPSAEPEYSSSPSSVPASRTSYWSTCAMWQANEVSDGGGKKQEWAERPGIFAGITRFSPHSPWISSKWIAWNSDRASSRTLAKGFPHLLPWSTVMVLKMKLKCRMRKVR